MNNVNLLVQFVNPSPSYPLLQVQKKLPIVFVQLALVEQGLDAHSLVSKYEILDPVESNTATGHYIPGHRTLTS